MIRYRKTLYALTGGLAALGAALAVGARHFAPAHLAPSTKALERSNTPPGMVYVPGGTCKIGSNDADADEDVRPMREVNVPSFYIDRTEVTNSEFRRFRPSYTFPQGEGNLPATN